MPFPMFACFLEPHGLRQEVNPQVMTEVIVQGRFVGEIDQRQWTVERGMIFVVPEQIQFRRAVDARFDPRLEIEAEIEVLVIVAVPETLDGAALVHGAACAADFKASCAIPVLFVPASVNDWMNEAFRGTIALGRMNFDGTTDFVRDRLVEALIDGDEMFAEELVEDGIVIRRVPFTEPPEPVRAFCRIHGFPDFGVGFFRGFGVTGEGVTGGSEHIPSAVFGGIADPGGETAIDPGATVQLFRGNFCSGGEFVEVFGDGYEFDVGGFVEDAVELGEEGDAVLGVEFPAVFTIEGDRH